MKTKKSITLTVSMSADGFNLDATGCNMVEALGLIRAAEIEITRQILRPEEVPEADGGRR